jgi:acetolactate synthase-1/2/3 large subunit
MSEQDATGPSGAAVLFDILREQGVEVIFAHTGGAVIPLHVELNRRLRRGSRCRRVIMCRQEPGAGHAAEGYARASGRVGVALATSGPGATNLTTPIADAYKDSIPTVFITGQVPSFAIGSDAFQEVDTVGRDAAHHQAQLPGQGRRDLPWVLREAFALAGSRAAWSGAGGHLQGRAADAAHEANPAGPTSGEPGLRRTARGRHPGCAVIAAERPVVKAGGGIIHAEAPPALCRFAEQFDVPVTTTFNALGAVPFDAPYASACPACTAACRPTTRCARRT